MAKGGNSFPLLFLRLQLDQKSKFTVISMAALKLFLFSLSATFLVVLLCKILESR